MRKKLLSFIAGLSLFSNINNFVIKDSSLEEYLLSIKKRNYENIIKSYFPKLDSIKYVPDSIAYGVSDFWQIPEKTDSLKYGDCEDKATLTYKLLRERGIPVRMVWGKISVNDTIGHIWTEYDIGKDSYVIETSVKSKIIPRSKLTKGRYPILCLKNYHKNKINEFEKRSGLELKFRNPIKID